MDASLKGRKLEILMNVKKLLREHGLRPNKRLGQHFLTDPAALRQVAEAGDVGVADTVLEIGAGLGSLTRYLAVQSKRVVAVEIDDRLIPPLKQVLAPFTNVIIIHGDILTLTPTDLLSNPQSPIPNFHTNQQASKWQISKIPNTQYLISNPQSPIPNLHLPCP